MPSTSIRPSSAFLPMTVSTLVVPISIAANNLEFCIPTPRIFDSFLCLFDICCGRDGPKWPEFVIFRQLEGGRCGFSHSSALPGLKA